MVRIFILSIFLAYSSAASAGQSLKIISDAEIETTLTNFMAPLVKAANLESQNIRIYIVNDPAINAFVAGGMNLFINSGLIIKFADDPNMLYGVIAHELAHIYAGHLSKMQGEFSNMQALAAGGMLLGMASALAGAPDAGAFIGIGATQAAWGNILSFSRENETEADKIAINFLYKTHNNGQGLIKLFQYLSQRDRGEDVELYVRTHPLTNERIASVKNSIKEKLSNFSDNMPQATYFKFKRMAAKLDAFLSPPERMVNNSNPYMAAIGNFRYGNIEKALSLLNQVIVSEPSNPYLLELKGQFYFENGQFNQASNFYQKSLQALPNEKLIKIELAVTQLNQARDASDAKLLNSAISLLKQVVGRDPDNVTAYFMLSRAYGKLGDQCKAILFLAEYYYNLGNYGKSKHLAEKVLRLAPAKSKEYLRASDILALGN